MLERMESLARDVGRFADQIHADFLPVRWDIGLVISWDAGQLKLTTTEVPAHSRSANLSSAWPAGKATSHTTAPNEDTSLPKEQIAAWPAVPRPPRLRVGVRPVPVSDKTL